MAMQRVDGKSYYVITSDVPAATDSRGKSYTSVYTDMRWKIWEQVQQATLAEMQMDADIYKSQLDSITERTMKQAEINAEMEAGRLERLDAIAKDRADFVQELYKSKLRQTKQVTTSERSGGSTGKLTVGDQTDKPRSGSKGAQRETAVTTRFLGEQKEGDEKLGLDAVGGQVAALREVEQGKAIGPDSKPVGVLAEEIPQLHYDNVATEIGTTYQQLRDDPELAGFSDADVQAMAEQTVTEAYPDDISDNYYRIKEAQMPTVDGPVARASSSWSKGSSRSERAPTFEMTETQIKNLAKEYFPDPKVDPDATPYGQDAMRQLEQEALGLQAPSFNLLDRSRANYERQIPYDMSRYVPEREPRTGLMSALKGFGEVQDMSKKTQSGGPKGAQDASPVGAEAVVPTAPPTEKGERSKYRMDVIAEGFDLASKSKKFERIAADPELKLASDIYTKNTQDKVDNPLKASYSALTDAYKDGTISESQLRKQQVYLIALDKRARQNTI